MLCFGRNGSKKILVGLCPSASFGICGGENPAFRHRGSGVSGVILAPTDGIACAISGVFRPPIRPEGVRDEGGLEVTLLDVDIVRDVCLCKNEMRSQASSHTRNKKPRQNLSGRSTAGTSAESGPLIPALALSQRRDLSTAPKC